MNMPNLKLKSGSQKLQEENKAIILAITSSGIKNDGEQSVEVQINTMREYCKKNNFIIIEEVKIAKSIIKEEYSEFKKIIEFISKYKSPMNLICHSIETLNRDLKSARTMLELVKEGKIVCHCLTENLISNKNLDYFIHLVNIIMHGKSVKFAFNCKRKAGTILGPAPIGYLNLPRASSQNKAVIKPDPERAYIIKQMFQDYATGLKSMEDVRREAEKKGLRSLRKGSKVKKSHIGKILSNPFYCGFMLSKGALYPHVYEKLITVELFEKCQEVRSGKRNKRCKQTNHPFIYRGLITCIHCGCSYSPNKKKGKYVYMYPRLKKDCVKCRNIREEVISEQLAVVMQKICIPEDILEKIKICLEEELNEQMYARNAELLGLKSKYQKLEEKRQKALHELTDSSITKDEYNSLVQSMKEEKLLIYERVEKLNETYNSFEKHIGSIFELSNKSYELFKVGTIEEKRRIISLLFQNLQMDGKKLIFVLQKPLDTWVKKEHVSSDYPNYSHS